MREAPEGARDGADCQLQPITTSVLPTHPFSFFFLRGQLPGKLNNQAYLTAQVAHRLENFAERLPSSGSSSRLLAMMLAIRSLCGQLKKAQAPEAGANRTISDVSRDISMQLDGMEALLSRGEWENIQLRALAEEAEQSALHVRATAAVMVRLAGGHK